MEATPLQVVFYETQSGRIPFDEWLESLRDKRTKTVITTRIRRIRLGNLGNYRSVGQGVCEFKIDYGPGYRIYFGQVGNTIVVILCGGDKNTQQQDILKAQKYWSDYGS